MNAREHRAEFHADVQAFHNAKPPAEVKQSVLPEGHRWVPHKSPQGPNPPRKYAPSPRLAEFLSL